IFSRGASTKMSLRFCESFDHYKTNAAFAQKWTEFNGAPAPSASFGRFGNGLRGTAHGFFRKTLDAQPTWIVGFAFFIESGGGLVDLVTLYDAGSVQSSLRITAA